MFRFFENSVLAADTLKQVKPRMRCLSTSFNCFCLCGWSRLNVGIPFCRAVRPSPSSPPLPSRSCLAWEGDIWQGQALNSPP